MADYRRELNNQRNECDYVIWGESDQFNAKTNVWGVRTIENIQTNKVSTDLSQHLVLEKCGTRVGSIKSTYK